MELLNLELRFGNNQLITLTAVVQIAFLEFRHGEEVADGVRNTVRGLRDLTHEVLEALRGREDGVTLCTG